MRKSILKKTILLLFFFLVLGEYQANAQFMLPGQDVEDTPQAPIDGLVGVFLALGAYFGGRKLCRKEK